MIADCDLCLKQSAISNLKSKMDKDYVVFFDTTLRGRRAIARRRH